jgi:protein TonB
MSSYRGTANRPDKAKAIAGVLLVHIALAAAILTGLNV